MFIAPMLLAAGLAAVLLLLVVAAQLVVPRLRGGSPVGPASPQARGELLHNGLRVQATITEVRTARVGASTSPRPPASTR